MQLILDCKNIISVKMKTINIYSKFMSDIMIRKFKMIFKKIKLLFAQKSPSTSTEDHFVGKISKHFHTTRSALI